MFATTVNHKIRVFRSKPAEGYFGVVCVCLGLIVSFGVSFYIGIPFNPVASTMPFLILAVGVDDAFLMLGAWRMTDPKDPIEVRMGYAMGDAGASITVTSLTNFGCFALGYWLSPTPAVADFCTLTSIGVIFDYIYQMTFFPAVMIYGARRENEGGLIAYFPCCRCKKSLTAEQLEEIQKSQDYHERWFSLKKTKINLRFQQRTCIVSSETHGDHSF